MSISTNKPKDTDTPFVDVIYTPSNRANISANNGKEPVSQPTKTEKPVAANSDTQNYLMDILLVVVLILIIAGGGYFIKTQMDRYSVPSAYEEASAENERLQQEFNQLIANKQKVSDVQKVKELQASISHKDTQLEEARIRLQQAKNTRAELQDAIQQEKRAIDQARYNLREMDRDFRAKALAELPGLPVPVATNRKTNSIVKNAIITKLEGTKNKKIHFRADNAVVGWDVKYLSKNELPAIMQYALGFADFVDMGILGDEDGKAKKKRKVIPDSTSVMTNTDAETAENDYDPESGAPVIINSHTETISSDPTATPDYESTGEPFIDEPTGALPL